MTTSRVTPGYLLPSVKFRRRLVISLSLATALVVAGIFLRFDPLLLFTEYEHVVRLASDMLPPNFALLWTQPGLYASVGETLAMAFLGTLVGGLLALFFAFFAASNTSPHPVVRNVVRTMFSIERATPNLVVLLVFLISFGYGPLAGMLALALGSIGMFGKLFADAIEQVEGGPTEAVAAVGASRIQIIRYSVIPQVLPSVVANWFYAFDVNVRAAIAIGVYGGGGIGFELQLAMKVLRYRDVVALVLLIIVLITLTERISDFVRRRLMTNGTLS